MTSSNPVACVQCRSRKSKCLGRTESNGCMRCVDAGIDCQVVPHNRGRKAGVKLSDETLAGIRGKYAAKAHANKAGKRGRSPDYGEESGPSTKNSKHVASSSTTTHQPPSLSPLSTTSPSSLLTIPGSSTKIPTSSVRVSSNTQAEIGPAASRSSSIASLFAPKNSEKAGRQGLSLYMEDPITCGFVDEANGRELYAFFMQKLADKTFVFDVHLHTYEYARHQSGFLFCAILAIAAKFRPDMMDPMTRQRCLALAKDHMLRVFSDYEKTEETIQALYIMTEYKEAEDEDGYLLLGIACRIALDLNLVQPRPDYNERQNRSRIRIWLALYAADRRYSYLGQTAKPSMMPHDRIPQLCKAFTQSPTCLDIDHLIANNVTFRHTLASHMDAIEKDNSESIPGEWKLDLREEYYAIEREGEEWERGQPVKELETPHANLAALLAKVIIAHRWVHRSFRDIGSSRDAEAQEKERREALAVCIRGSLGLLETMTRYPVDVLKYGSDSTHLYFAYASFFLQKVFDTQIASIMLDRPSFAYMYDLFKRCAERLEQASISSTHTAAFHAGFLRRLMRSCEDMMQDVNEQGHTGQGSTLGGGGEPDVGILPEAPSKVPLESFEREVPHSTALPSYVPDPVQLPILTPQDLLPPTFDMLLEPLTNDILGDSITWDDWWPMSDMFGGARGGSGLFDGSGNGSGVW
ncbi:hypothetical protein L202_00234 [Cryptococcus amylolentus CBS 6039]|uniref:Zn(2)-C6 fungal-type domain-containing protein n=3 Tax=Cryptococcus amylolentus CBS 6039 TaxID=1295533 RepID=A0A1E3I6I2_9TREE|nr:hypothetical protein L202_00234 [Cryptococcus amylolentus CBS 6039]ODN84239.1 hypothetical protein L202_00234 [Cryptococcus amylolentus CBS 6039]